MIFMVVLLLSHRPTPAQTRPVASQPARIDTTGSLIYPFKDEGAFDYPDKIEQRPLFLRRPANIERKVEYDPNTKQYIIYEKVGNTYYRLPKTMSLQEYVQYDFEQSIKDYWRTRREAERIENSETGSLIPQLRIDSEAFTNIFGSNTIDIRPQGYVEVSFGYQSTFIDDKTRPVHLRRIPTFDFDQQINMSVTGKIGDKVDMRVNFNTEATFDYENKMNINYAGKEDEILRKIEAGNVSLPLNGTLIQGGTNLFGFKTEMQFGKLNLTTVISQHKGESQTIETEGGVQRTKFGPIKVSEYDENRHFFLSKYFRDNYDKSMAKSPVVLSNVSINKIEIWVTNKNQDFTGSRDIVAFVDLGEQEKHIYNKVSEFGPVLGTGYPKNTFPHNNANLLYEQIINFYSDIRTSSKVVVTLAPLSGQNFKNGQDWEKIDQARKLKENEYILNAKLGYISLSAPLNADEVLAVAYNYTIGDTTLQVGEFSSDGIDAPKTLVLKLLKGTNLSPGFPTWDLMMKNIYNIGAFDLSDSEFDFNIVYRNDSTNTYVNYLPEGIFRKQPCSV
jgi:cell surface protein SprA